MRGPIVALALIAAAGCERQRTTPTIKPTPAPDPAGPLRVPGPLSPRIANYRIDARYDARQHRIEATQTLRWRNAGASAVDELCFGLAMNAFEPDSRFMRASGGVHRDAVADLGRLGGTDVSSIQIGGAELRERTSFAPPDQTVMLVPLPAPVEPGGELAVDMAFSVQLPRVFARVGYAGEFAMVGHWFPKIGVRTGLPGAETWSCEPLDVTHEFFADFGVYDVTLVVPDTHVVAATGVLTGAVDNGDGTRTLTYRAEDVHDFAWMADPFMEVTRGVARVGDGEVEVRVLHRPSQRAMGARHLRAAVGALELLSELLVPYPYSVLSVIDPPAAAQAGAGGVEYPTLVTTQTPMATLGLELVQPEYVTVHEVGHQWFQGMIASNEIVAPWLDEGVNEYIDAIVMATLYPDDLVAAEALALRRAGLSWWSLPRVPIATAASEFPDFDTFALVAYTWTALALRTLEGAVGRERMLAALGRYARAWAFRHPTGDDLLASLSASLGDLDWFEAIIERGAVPAFAVASIDCSGARRCAVGLENRGDVAVPVDVEVRFAGGAVRRERWDDGRMWRQLVYEDEGLVTEVVIDPDREVPINRTPIERGLRLGAQREATRRAAGAAAFWTQTAMQVLGL